MEANKLLIFLCAGALKAAEKKLSYRIATQLTNLGVGEMATLQDLSRQQATPEDAQCKMIFINNCKAGCLNILTQHFHHEKYIFFDVAQYIGVTEFNVENYVASEMIPLLRKKWGLFGGRTAALEDDLVSIER